MKEIKNETFRKISPKFFSDTDIIEKLSIYEKMIYLHILCSNRNSQCGISTYSTRELAMYCDTTLDVVNNSLAGLQKHGYIINDIETSEIFVNSFWSYYASNKPSAITGAYNDSLKIKSKKLLKISEAKYIEFMGHGFYRHEMHNIPQPRRTGNPIGRPAKKTAVPTKQNKPVHAALPQPTPPPAPKKVSFDMTGIPACNKKNFANMLEMGVAL